MYINNNLLILYLIFILFHKCLSKKISNLASEITITINGTNRQQILGMNKAEDYIPDQLLLNGEIISYTEPFLYNLINQINNITFIWNNPLTSCYTMFYSIKNMIYADLSKFYSFTSLK